jgi:S-DNA-T family DNA segregation ATPase FtsK/SpoIIIE
MRTAVLAAALDPDVRIYLWDLKGSPDWRPFRHVAHEYHAGEDVDPDTAVDPVGRLLEVARELRVEVGRRNRVLRNLPATEVPEGKLTERLCRARHMDLPLIVLAVDEVHRAFTHREHGAELADELADLVRVGPSAGVIVIDGTQKPGSIGSGQVAEAWKMFRDNHAARFGLRVGSWQVSDLVLGAGAYSEGMDTSVLPEAARGVGILRGTGDVAVAGGICRTYLVDGSGAEQICLRARQLREDAGTLTGMAVGEQPASGDDTPRRSLLADLVQVMGADEQAHSDVLCGRLAETWPQVYGGWQAEQLAAALKPHDVATRQVWAASTDGVRRNRRGVVRAELYAAAGEPAGPSGGGDS